MPGATRPGNHERSVMQNTANNGLANIDAFNFGIGNVGGFSHQDPGAEDDAFFFNRQGREMIVYPGDRSPNQGKNQK